MCEALFNLNKSFLSLPIDAINGVALSAMMRDHYNNLAALGDPSDRGKSRPGSVRGTPSRPPRPPSRRESPARTPTSAAANGAGGVPRVVGRRTPRHGAPRRLTSEKAADDADAVEMAGAALVSMSPGGMAHRCVAGRRRRASRASRPATFRIADALARPKTRREEGPRLFRRAGGARGGGRRRGGVGGARRSSCSRTRVRVGGRKREATDRRCQTQTVGGETAERTDAGFESGETQRRRRRRPPSRGPTPCSSTVFEAPRRPPGDTARTRRERAVRASSNRRHRCVFGTGFAAADTFARPAPTSRRPAWRSSRAVSDASGRNTWTTMLSSTGVSVAFVGMSPGRLPRRLRLSLSFASRSPRLAVVGSSRNTSTRPSIDRGSSRGSGTGLSWSTSGWPTRVLFRRRTGRQFDARWGNRGD